MTINVVMVTARRGSHPPRCPTGRAALSLADLELRPQCCCRSPRRGCSPEAQTETASTSKCLSTQQSKITNKALLGSSDQNRAHLQLFILSFELLVLIRVAVGELVDLYPVLIYLFPQLRGQHTKKRCDG